MSSRRVRQLLADKGIAADHVFSVTPQDTVYRALELMAEQNVGLLVVFEDAKLVGVISERDYARKIILRGLRSREVAVADVMTRSVITVGLDDTVGQCMQFMNQGRFRHLPVLDGSQVVGVVSITDVLRSILAEQAFEIEQLQGYIGGQG